MVEQLAAEEHERWSAWMRWMFSNWTEENIARWKLQMVTDYTDLPEHSKESDRKEARKTLKVMREPTKEMIEVYYKTDFSESPFVTWRAMIDAALEESK